MVVDKKGCFYAFVVKVSIRWRWKCEELWSCPFNVSRHCGSKK